MSEKRDLTVNQLPGRTWNWLGMNESRLNDIETTGSLTVKKEAQQAGVLWNQEILQDVKMPEWTRITTGMGSDMDLLLDGCAEDMIVSETGDSEGNPTVLRYVSNDGDKTGNRLCLYAKKNSRLNAVIVCESEKDAKGFAALQTRIYAEEGAKVTVSVAQLLGEGFTALCDFGGRLEDGASVELVKVELGAGKLYAGGEFGLYGAKSSFESHIAYFAGREQRYDMNYTAMHLGKKTVSLMDVSGVLNEDAFKLFRGTINFLPGCAGAKGDEREDVLLLADDLTNQTIPLILCQEEDVEGNHGASIGKLDDSILFYMGTRGIAPEEARRMVAKARVAAVSEKIPDEGVREQIRVFMEGKEV